MLFYMFTVASAMSALQTKGIVHRDLKPQNLLLNHSGSTNPPPSDIKVKIGKLKQLLIKNNCSILILHLNVSTADFGFARFLPGEMMAATLCGSPMYMVSLVNSLLRLASQA